MKSLSKLAPNLRFPGFQGDWWKSCLHELTEKSITYGIVQTGDSVEGGVKCVRVVDLTKPEIILDELITTTEEISRSYKRTILVEGEIMVALRGEIGLLALVPKSLEGSNLTRGIARIAPKLSVVHPEYLVWALRCDASKVEFIKQVNGSALKEIPINGLNKIEVQLTSLPEQQKIADFLTEVDKRIQQLSQKKALLEDYKKGVMQQLFTQALRFKDDHGNDFPDWEEKTLGELLIFKNGFNAEKDQYGTGVKFINVLDVLSPRPITYKSIIGQVEIPEKDFPKFEVKFGDLLFQRSSETREEVGQANVYLDKERSAGFGGFVIRGQPKAKFDSLFMNYLLRTPLARNEITTKSGGSTRYNVSQDTLGEARIVMPSSLPEQTKIADFLTSLDRKIETVASQITHTQTFKKGLLQQMFV